MGASGIRGGRLSVVLACSVISLAWISPAQASPPQASPAQASPAQASPPSVWTNEPVPSAVSPLSSISCPAPSECVAVGYAEILMTTNSGSTWTVTTAPDGVYGLGAISCPSVSDCVALGLVNTTSSSYVTAALATTDGGGSWTEQVVSDGTPVLMNEMSCASTTECVGAGTTIRPGSVSEGVIVETTDGGARWTRTNEPPSKVSSLNGVSCASTLDCVAVGGWGNGFGYSRNVIAITADGGDVWTRESTPEFPMGSLGGVSCSSSDCIAVGDPGYVLTSSDGGISWTKQYLPSQLSHRPLLGVSCLTVTDCVAISEPPLNFPPESIFVTENGGTSWTNEQVPSRVTYLSGVTCASATSCTAVGEHVKGSTSTGVIIGSTRAFR